MKTRIITAAVGLGVLAVVLAFFDTFLFDLVLSAVCLIAIHEVFSAMGFGKKQWYLYAAAVPLTLLVMLSTSQMVRGLLLPAGDGAVCLRPGTPLAQHMPIEGKPEIKIVYLNFQLNAYHTQGV